MVGSLTGLFILMMGMFQVLNARINIENPSNMASAEDIFLDFYCSSRPEWIPSVVNGFQSAHFGEAGAHGLSLNHVLSWNSIKKKVSLQLEDGYLAELNNNVADYSTLKDFVNLLFKVDTMAMVYNHQNPLTGTISWMSMRHEDYLARGHLTNLNEEYKDHAIRIIEGLNGWFSKEHNAQQGYEFIINHQENAVILQNLMGLLHNAPANLRYGHKGTNSGIGDKLDPIGCDKSVGPTKKEVEWMEKWWEVPHVHTEENQITPTLMSSSTGNIPFVDDKKNNIFVIGFQYPNDPEDTEDPEHPADTKDPVDPEDPEEPEDPEDTEDPEYCGNADC